MTTQSNLNLAGSCPHSRSSSGSEFHDDLWEEAIKVVREKRNAGQWVYSGLQRHLRIGYNRAARIAEEMERIGWLTDGCKNENFPQNRHISPRSEA